MRRAFQPSLESLNGVIKSPWGKLTDDDVDRIAGDAEGLIGRIQERYGYARERAMREVDDFFDRHVQPDASKNKRPRDGSRLVTHWRLLVVSDDGHEHLPATESYGFPAVTNVDIEATALDPCTRV
jgi:uncharacterized protein YjbJ (UPF0337 family)